MSSYVQIHSDSYSWFKSIVYDRHLSMLAEGVDSYVAWGRGREPDVGLGESGQPRELRLATTMGLCRDALLSRLDDRDGFHSRVETRRLLDWLDVIGPDIVHLHQMHGYYMNVEMLFGWLAAHRCQVRWTLHDCWALTGHCSHFTMVKCEQWKHHCSYSEKCPQLREYPKTYGPGACRRNFADKRRIFTSVPPERMTLIVPSQWLADLVAQSFLRDYPIMVRHNEIDRTLFKPTPSGFRKQYGIGDRFMILGVASPWTERKGLGDFVRLAGELDSERFTIVLVGLSEKQVKEMPGNVVGITRTELQSELAGIYTAADVFFNPTKEDNYPTVNLEAEACGTPVITYDVGGCRETIGLLGSFAVSGYEGALEVLQFENKKKRSS